MADTEKKPKEEALPPDHGALLGSWGFLEHDRHERGMWWYIITSVVLLALIAYSIYDQNYLLTVILVLALLVFVITELRGPDTRTFSAYEDGLQVGTAFYPFTEIRNFFIIYEPPDVKMLYFDPKSIFRPMVGVPILDEDPNDLRTVLLEFIPEDIDREHEPVGDFLGRFFKF